MDNCDLEKLAVSRGQLQPEFTPEVTDYKVTVESSVEKVSLDLAPSDSGASCRIVSRTSSQPGPYYSSTRSPKNSKTVPLCLKSETVLLCLFSWGGTAPRTSSWRWEWPKWRWRLCLRMEPSRSTASRSPGCLRRWPNSATWRWRETIFWIESSAPGSWNTTVRDT